jgi:hypothetical protein
MSDFQSEFLKRLNARYVVLSAPQRVDDFEHDVKTEEGNAKMAAWLRNRAATKLEEIPGVGTMNLYDTAVVTLSPDASRVLALITFEPTTFNGKHAAMLQHLWKDKAVKAPLASIALFKHLIPRFKIVGMGEQHTLDGEQWAKKRTEQALKDGYHVYLTNEHGTLFEAHTFKEVLQRPMWGDGVNYRERLIILTTNAL